VAAEPIIPSQFHMADMLEPLFTDQAKVVLTEDWSFHRGLFTKKYKEKGPRKKFAGLKGGVVIHQGGILLGWSLIRVVSYQVIRVVFHQGGHSGLF